MPEETADNLRERISEGEWRPGDRLPSEPALADRLGVSRATLRDAIRVLEQDGYVRRMHGSGTYVTERPRLRNNLEQNFGVTDLIEELGLRPGTRERRLELEPADAEVAEALGTDQCHEVHALHRIRTADDLPIIYSVDHWLPETLDPGALEGHRSIYDSFAADERPIHHGVARIRPANADRALAAGLSANVGALVLVLFQVDYDELDNPLMASREFHLADVVETTVYRKGPGAPRPQAG